MRTTWAALRALWGVLRTFLTWARDYNQFRLWTALRWDMGWYSRAVVGFDAAMAVSYLVGAFFRFTSGDLPIGVLSVTVAVAFAVTGETFLVLTRIQRAYRARYIAYVLRNSGRGSDD